MSVNWANAGGAASAHAATSRETMRGIRSPSLRSRENYAIFGCATATGDTNAWKLCADGADKSGRERRIAFHDFLVELRPLARSPRFDAMDSTVDERPAV